MFDPIYDALLDMFEDDDIGPGNLESKLSEYGLMIVPIEDPTNIFGIMEDSE